MTHTNTEALSDAKLNEMLAGLEGVTPGPWDAGAGLVRAIDGDVAIPIFEGRDPWKKHRRTSTVVRQAWHNLDHVSRCDPDTMRQILTELIALRSAVRFALSHPGNQLTPVTRKDMETSLNEAQP